MANGLCRRSCQASFEAPAKSSSSKTMRTVFVTSGCDKPKPPSPKEQNRAIDILSAPKDRRFLGSHHSDVMSPQALIPVCPTVYTLFLSARIQYQQRSVFFNHASQKKRTPYIPALNGGFYGARDNLDHPPSRRQWTQGPAPRTHWRSPSLGRLLPGIWSGNLPFNRSH
jgi:hypothetical protein